MSGPLQTQASPRPGRHSWLHSARLITDDRASGATGDDRERAGAAGPPTGDAIIGATLEGLRRAAEEVEHVAAVAETLQRSLLPDRLPELPGLGLSARYVAGATDAQVGGDWYDVIALRDGQAGIAIGDVVGHGLDAAARMARLQNALRAYALEGLRPSLVLERMNGFAREVSGGPMATLLYGVVDPEEGKLRLATAGHPPVLVIGPDGEAYFAEGPAGSPLGVVPFPAYEESTIPLVPGSTETFGWVVGVDRVHGDATELAVGHPSVAGDRLDLDEMDSLGQAAQAAGKLCLTAKTPGDVDKIVRNTFIQGTLSIVFASVVVIVFVAGVVVVFRSLQGTARPLTEDEPVPSRIFAPSGLIPTKPEREVQKQWDALPNSHARSVGTGAH